MAVKQFTWQGKTEDEIKQLDLESFIKLVPSRQRRSLKRGFTPAQKSLVKRLEVSGSDNIKTHCRNIETAGRIGLGAIRSTNSNPHLRRP